jgi:tripartite-type tricarboxylate transporter receptor subunit TctC
MIYSRRAAWLTAAAATAVMLAATFQANSQSDRPITMVVAQAPGGGSDIVTRLWANFASKKLNQTIVVDNRPGAGGILAAKQVLGRPTDGYTLYSAGTSSTVLNRFTYKSLPFEADKDFQGVGMLVRIPYLLVVNNESGIKSLDDLRKAAQSGTLNLGSAGAGNATHIIPEMLQAQLGFKLNHVPYRGEAAALSGLMAGDVHVVLSVVGTALPLATAGLVTPLIVLGSSRLAELPQVPTADQAGLLGYSDLVWAAIIARNGTPERSIRRLNEVTQQFLADPEVRQQLEKMHFEPMPGPPDLYERLVARDTSRFAKATKGLNLLDP